MLRNNRRPESPSGNSRMPGTDAPRGRGGGRGRAVAGIHSDLSRGIGPFLDDPSPGGRIHAGQPRRDIVRSLLLLLLPAALTAQQVADTSFNPPIASPAHARGAGPVVVLDEAHHNFHTVAGRYRPWVMLMERDGFTVRANRAPFTRQSLAGARVLVIANALNAVNAPNRWRLPNPSAFTDDEIVEVREWVREGGALLLIADHMPFAGAAEKLALEFGAVFGNGYAADSALDTGAMRFRRGDGSLAAHPITDGRSPAERVDSVTTFTGSAFRLLGGGTPLITLRAKTTLLLPVTAWVFSDSTPRVRSDGLLQGAALEFGRGRVVFLAEAAMLSAQLGGPQRQPMGMNDPVAAQNPQFALNVMRWLSRSR